MAGGRQRPLRSWGDHRQRTSYASAVDRHIYTTGQRPAQPRVSILSRSEEDQTFLASAPEHLEPAFGNPVNQSTTSDSADAEPTEDLTAFSQYTDDMSHFLNELTENGDEDANIPRSQAPMSLEDYVTVKPAGRKARTQDRSRGLQQYERQMQTQASANLPAKSTSHQPNSVYNTEHKAEVNRETLLPHRQRTPSTLLGLTDMIHQIPSMRPLSALDVETFFGDPSREYEIDGMFKNAKHANGDITVFLWRSPTQMWNIVGTVKGTFASLLQQLEMDSLEQSITLDGVLNPYHLRMSIERGVKRLESLGSPHHTNDPSPIIPGWIKYQRRKNDGKDASASQEKEQRAEGRNEASLTHKPPHHPPRLSEFFSTPGATSEPQTVQKAFNSHQPRRLPPVDPMNSEHCHRAFTRPSVEQSSAPERLRRDSSVRVKENPEYSSSWEDHADAQGSQYSSAMEESPLARFDGHFRPGRTLDGHYREDQLAAMKRTQDHETMRRTVLHDPLSSRAVARNQKPAEISNRTQDNPARVRNTDFQPEPQQQQAPAQNFLTQYQPNVQGGTGFYQQQQHHPPSVSRPLGFKHLPAQTIHPGGFRDPSRATDDALRLAYPFPLSLKLLQKNQKPFSDPEMVHGTYSAPLAGCTPGLGADFALDPDKSITDPGEVHGQNLDDWWSSGLDRFNRQSEYASYLAASRGLAEDSDALDAARIGVLLSDQLKSHAEGRKDMKSPSEPSISGQQQPKGDYFISKFVDPPAHCIKEGASPRESLFSEDGLGEPAPAQTRSRLDPRCANVQISNDEAIEPTLPIRPQGVIGTGRSGNRGSGSEQRRVVMPVSFSSTNRANLQGSGMPMMGRFG